MTISAVTAALAVYRTKIGCEEMFSKRLLTAAVGIPVAIYVVNYGGLFFYLAVNLLALVGILELLAMFRRVGHAPSQTISLSAGLLMLAVVHFGNFHELGFLVTVLLMSLLCMLIFKKDVFPVPDAAITLLITLYMGWLFAFLILLRNSSPDMITTSLGQISAGAAFTWMAIIATWANDTCAYFVGSAWGKHKLCPEISPGKTIEGAIGGLAGSLIVSTAAGTFMQIPLIHSVILGLLMGVLAPVGDLVESAFKRYTGVKDAGKIFPGHGGVLDRFDSLLFVVPGVYYYLKFFLIN